MVIDTKEFMLMFGIHVKQMDYQKCGILNESVNEHISTFLKNQEYGNK